MVSSRHFLICVALAVTEIRWNSWNWKPPITVTLWFLYIIDSHNGSNSGRRQFHYQRRWNQVWRMIHFKNCIKNDVKWMWVAVMRILCYYSWLLVKLCYISLECCESSLLQILVLSNARFQVLLQAIVLLLCFFMTSIRQ